MAYASKRPQGPMATLWGLTLVLVLVGCRSGIPVTAGAPSQASLELGTRTNLEAIRLPPPGNDEQRAYLGVPAIAPFRLADIQTRILILEFYSMYCPHCQREAPQVNRLYERIRQDARLRSAIKLIGVAVGNTSYEIDIFRQTYDVRFPLFADRSRTVAKSLGVYRTPTFIAIVYRPGGILEPILDEPGGIENIEEFLTDIIQRSGIELDGP